LENVEKARKMERRENISGHLQKQYVKNLEKKTKTFSKIESSYS